MADQYDVIIIGAGPGGYNCAIRCGQLGLKVACVESRETLGGTCLNVGCMPSKALLHATELYETAQKDFPSMGLKATVEADIPAMIESKEIDEKTIVSSTGALDMQEVPEHLLVIGGGVIGLELGSVWRRLGAKVTVVEYMPTIMVNSDKEIQKAALRMLKRKLRMAASRKILKRMLSSFVSVVGPIQRA